MSPHGEVILKDALGGGHMWSDPENRPTVEVLMDLGFISFVQTKMASGQIDPRIPTGISPAGIRKARELLAAV